MENQKNLDIESFVDKLVFEKGLSELDAEVLAQVKSDLVERVSNHVNATILEHMPDDKLDEFNKVLDNDESAVREFVKDNIEDLDNIIAATLLSFRRTYLGT